MSLPPAGRWSRPAEGARLMPPTNMLYYGEERPLPARQSLRAGPLSLVFEEGDLRYVRLGDHEILRRVYSAVRDRNWGTVPVSLSNLRVEAGADAFRITYDAENRVPGPARSLGGERVMGEIDFAWQAEITGDAAGTIRFSMEGQARSTFLRSRIGFCILHPGSDCAGQPCTVEKVDGTIEQGEFP